MPIRNPFARRPGVVNGTEVREENIRPVTLNPASAQAGFEKVDIIGSKASSSLSIRSTRSRDTGDYKMSG